MLSRPGVMGMDADKLREMKRIAFEMKNWKEVRRINKMMEFHSGAVKRIRRR